MKRINDDVQNKTKPDQLQDKGPDYDESLMKYGWYDEEKIRAAENKGKVFKKWAVCILGVCLTVYGLVSLIGEIQFLLKWGPEFSGIGGFLYAAGFIVAGVIILIAGIIKK